MTPLEFAFRRAYASVMSGSGLKRAMDDEPRPIVVTFAAGLAMLYGMVAFAVIAALGAVDSATLFGDGFKLFGDGFLDIILSPILIILFAMFLLFAVVGGVSAGIFLAGLAAWRRKPWARWPLIVAYFVGGATFALLFDRVLFEGFPVMLAAGVINVAAAVGLLTKAAARWYESA